MFMNVLQFADGSAGAVAVTIAFTGATTEDWSCSN